EPPKGENFCGGLFPEGFPSEGGKNLGNSLIKLEVRQSGISFLQAVPDPEQQAIDKCDMDLGGSGPLIVPGTKLIIGGGKRGKLYLMSPNASGTYQFSNPQKVYDGPEEQINEPVCRTQGQFHIMGGPVHWKDPSGQSIVYVSAESSKIRA